MLPNDDKPWAKSLARTVIFVTLIGLALLSYYLERRNQFHIPEIVGVFLLFLTIVPPNLAILYPGLLPPRDAASHNRNHKSATR